MNFQRTKKALNSPLFDLLTTVITWFAILLALILTLAVFATVSVVIIDFLLAVHWNRMFDL